MNENVWNEHQITSMLTAFLYAVIFLTIICCTIFCIKKTKKIRYKLGLAMFPIVLALLFYYFTAYFFPDIYLKSIAEKFEQRSYKWSNTEFFSTVEEGSLGPPVKEKLRNITAEISQETITRNRNEYTYRGLLSVHDHTGDTKESSENYIYRTYKWKVWKFKLVGLGTSGD